MKNGMPRRACIDLGVPMTFDAIGVARRVIEELGRDLGLRPDFVARLIVATHELAENAVRFSLDGGANVSIEVDRNGCQVRAAVHTSNRAAAEDIRALLTTQRAARDADDRAAFYRESMLAAAHRSNGSGLGIARVTAEAEMQIVVRIALDVVMVTATLEERAQEGSR